MCESRKEYEEKLNERLVSAEKTIEAYHNLRDDLKTVIVEKIRLHHYATAELLSCNQFLSCP